MKFQFYSYSNYSIAMIFLYLVIFPTDLNIASYFFKNKQTLKSKHANLQQKFILVASY